jgi:kynureninase
MSSDPTVNSTAEFRSGAEFAREMDAADPLSKFRERFCIPERDGKPVIYLCGNSLGLQPQAARDYLDQELRDWAHLAVDAHFDGQSPWYSYHEQFRDVGARLVGAQPGEVVMMNGLTVNLHLMMVSFFRPTAQRFKIVIEHPAFPSDIYAVKTQLSYHGLDPDDALIELAPRPGEHVLRTEDIEAVLEREGPRIALVMLGAVNYYTGQWFDMPRITAAAQQHGCIVGFDLAHAAGNVPLQLHDWNIDFAVWCSYKYLNAGPGAVAGCFVHDRHTGSDLPRFGGWWGKDPSTRFKMHLEPEFVPHGGAESWQLSNPPIMAMAPLRASLEIFDLVGMRALRGKSELLTGYMNHLLRGLPDGSVEIITPSVPSERGAQLSIFVHEHVESCFKALADAGVMCDLRRPNVIRVAAVPLYNTFEDVWHFARILRETLSA